METMSTKNVSFSRLFLEKCLSAPASTIMKAVTATKNNASPGLIYYSEGIGSLEVLVVLTPDIS